jgi:dihydropteroate synthase
MGTHKQVQALAKKVRNQYDRLCAIGKRIEDDLSTVTKRCEMTIGGQTFAFGSRTYIMGIINVTPDSFYDVGICRQPKDAAKRAVLLAEEGADIIDVGGESSRPGADPVGEREERARVLPALDAIRDVCDVPVSIDTVKPAVADAALDRGADMVNDITALQTPGMAETVADHNVPVCLMHMQGTPKTMQENPAYRGTVTECIHAFLAERIACALEKGIAEDNLIVDPGIGFGKRTGNGIEDNADIIAHLGELKSLGRPVLVGISQKSFIGTILDAGPDQRREGSLGAETVAIVNGADIVRCHHVRETVRMARVVDRIVRH